MSHFYGWLNNGGRKESTRASQGKRPYTAVVQGHKARIIVSLWHDEEGRDHYEVMLLHSTLDSSKTVNHKLAEGILDIDALPRKDIAILDAIARIEGNYT